MNRRELINWPNFLSVLRICLTPLFLVMLSAETWYWRSAAFVVFVLAALTDYYDGRLARSANKVTSVGRFLDPLADKILVTSALVAFAWARLVHAWLIVPIIVRDVVITGMRLYGIYRGRQMVTTRLAKWKTAVQFITVVVILFLVGLQELLGQFNREGTLPAEGVQVLINGLMAAVLVLTVLSGFHYLFRASFSFNKS
jgi:CDP-diacylglycerol--glycerol-3-phosphate 3-phosphatidyltransferase